MCIYKYQSVNNNTKDSTKSRRGKAGKQKDRKTDSLNPRTKQLFVLQSKAVYSRAEVEEYTFYVSFKVRLLYFLFSSSLFFFVINFACFVAILPFYYAFKIFIQYIFPLCKFLLESLCVCVFDARSSQTHRESCFALSCRRRTALNAENEYLAN